jgi:hypothetical protein
MNLDASIPASGAEGVPYFERRELINGVLAHSAEMFIGQVLGAGGVGGELTEVPFEPAVIEIINEAGATPTWTKHVNLGSGFIGLAVAAAAADATANAPTLTEVGDNDWTVGLVTGDAPDGETVTVICYGARDVNGGL